MGVVLVTRKGCHLCDEALSLIRELGVEPELADIDADESLFKLYDWRVPVVLVAGHVAAEGRINREGLRKILTAELKP
jgi:predicted thioredoxin/glutaredoxin